MRRPSDYPNGDKRFCSLLHNKNEKVRTYLKQLIYNETRGFHVDIMMTFLRPPEPMVHD